MGEACPGAWTVTDLTPRQVAEGRWFYEGTLLRGQPPLERHGRGTCPSGTGLNDLFTFVAPEAGTYVFETAGQRGDTVMWVRTACGISGAAAELGCSDDEPGLGRFSRVSGDLRNQQRVYVFVDSFSAEERGAYTLTVRRD